jgi:RNA polymerase sigma factor (TIGR02999 family)
VHEVYLRLVDLNELTLHNRTHFFAVAARLMRQILVDHARRKRAGKRGGGVAAVSLADSVVGAERATVDILALDEALDKLRAFDPRQCDVVELRFFAGLNVEEVAEALAISRQRQSASGRWRKPGSMTACRRGRDDRITGVVARTQP